MSSLLCPLRNPASLHRTCAGLPPLHVLLVDGLWAASFDYPSRRAFLWMKFNGPGKFGRLSHHQLLAANLTAGAAGVVGSFITGNISSSCPRVMESRSDWMPPSLAAAYSAFPKAVYERDATPQTCLVEKPISWPGTHRPPSEPMAAICHLPRAAQASGIGPCLMSSVLVRNHQDPYLERT